MHEQYSYIYLHAHNVRSYDYIIQTKISDLKQYKGLNCKLTLYWQAIYCTRGLRMLHNQVAPDTKAL